MFTGIITGVGRILSAQELGCGPAFGKRLTIEAPEGYLDGVELGDSIALNGACMTVAALASDGRGFSVDVSAQSLEKTTGLSSHGPVNLEKALRACDRLGGHIVSGHVDGVGQVTYLAEAGESWELRVLAPPTLRPYLANKGSVTLNGVSLTINRVVDLPEGCEIGINLIPHTMRSTSLGALRAGARVNLEIDLLARYVARMLEARGYEAAA